MNQLMSADEIKTVTGTSRMSLQCQVLTEHRIFFIKDRNGCPHVTWYNFNHPSHLRFNQAQAHSNEPDFSAMR